MSLSKGDIVELVNTFNTKSKIIKPSQISDDMMDEFNKEYDDIAGPDDFSPYGESENSEKSKQITALADKAVMSLSDVNEADAAGSYVPTSDFLKQLYSMGGPVNEDDRMEFDGKTFIVKSFETDDEVNDFLATEEGSKWGVLTEKDGKIYVAKLTDLGEAQKIKEAQTRNIQPGYGGYVIHDDGTLIKGYSTGGSPNWYYDAWTPIDSIGIDNPYSTITSVGGKYYGRIGTNRTTTDRAADHKRAYDYIRGAFPTLAGGTEQDGQIISTQGVSESKEIHPLNEDDMMEIAGGEAKYGVGDKVKVGYIGSDLNGNEKYPNREYGEIEAILNDKTGMYQVGIYDKDGKNIGRTTAYGKDLSPINEDKDPNLMPYNYKGTQQQLEADLKMLYGDITISPAGTTILYFDKDGDQPLGKYVPDGQSIIWVYPSSAEQWSSVNEDIDLNSIKKNLLPYLKNKTVDAAGNISGLDDYIDSDGDSVVITIPYAAIASMDDAGAIVDLMNKYEYTKSAVVDGDKQALVITMFNENRKTRPARTIYTNGYYLYNENVVRGGYKKRVFATKEAAMESLTNSKGGIKYTNVVKGDVLAEILEARGINDIRTTNAKLGGIKYSNLLENVNQLRSGYTYILDRKIPVVYEHMNTNGGHKFIILEGEDIGMPVTIDNGALLTRLYLGQIQEAEGNKVLETGQCECRIAPMGNNGLEGFDTGEQYKYEHMSADKEGKPYYRLYQDESYSTCGTGTFDKYFEKIGSPLTNEPVQEAANYELYYSSFSDAVQAARKYAEDMGYTINDDIWFSNISTGPAKPDEGETNGYVIPLMINGQESKAILAIQVFNRGNNVGNNYELNCYVDGPKPKKANEAVVDGYIVTGVPKNKIDVMLDMADIDIAISYDNGDGTANVGFDSEADMQDFKALLDELNRVEENRQLLKKEALNKNR